MLVVSARQGLGARAATINQLRKYNVSFRVIPGSNDVRKQSRDRGSAPAEPRLQVIDCRPDLYELLRQNSDFGTFRLRWRVLIIVVAIATAIGITLICWGGTVGWARG